MDNAAHIRILHFLAMLSAAAHITIYFSKSVPLGLCSLIPRWDNELSGANRCREEEHRHYARGRREYNLPNNSATAGYREIPERKEMIE